MNNEQVELFITKHVNEDKDSFFIEDYDDETVKTFIIFH